MKKASIATVLLVGIVLVPLLALAGFMTVEPSAVALNEWASAYAGYAYLSTDDSIPVPDGTPIRAIQGSTPLAETTTGFWQEFADNEFYFSVSAELGTEVNFEIWVGDWLPAEETAIHVGLGLVYIDLHTGTGTPDPTPTLTTTPTPIPTPTLTPDLGADNPSYTYWRPSAAVVLHPGVEDTNYHPWDLNIGIDWGSAVPRDVPTDMGVVSGYPENIADSFIFSFDPQSFTLNESNGYSQKVWVTVYAKEGANTTGEDYILCKINAYDVGGGTPVIAEGVGCFDYIRVTDSEGCFIATAAYGTSTAVEIDTLRAFRDEVLLENSLGSQLVDFYYEVSPPVADFISENSLLRTLVRELLVDPVASLVEATETLWRN